MRLSVALVTVVFAVTGVVESARVRFYPVRSCDGAASNDFQNVGCNVCIDPPGDWSATQVDEIGNQRWTAHNQDNCTPASQVAQVFGGSCVVQGNTALRSVWVSC